MIKNTLLSALSIFVLGNLCRLGLPWWCIAFIAALAGWLVARNALSAFGGGLLGGFTLWAITAWFADSANGGLLSAKVGQLFMGVSGAQLLLVTGLLGGLIAAFGALAGFWAKDLLQRPKRKSYLQERRR